MKIGRFNEIDDRDSISTGIDELHEVESSEESSELEGVHYHSEMLSDTFRKLFPTSMNDERKTEKRLSEYIEMLNQDTPESPEEGNQESEFEYSKEELQDIWDNDPGYLNINAIRRFEGENDPENKRAIIDPESGYMQLGFHRGGLENYGHDSIEGTEVEVILQPGKVLERWGNEEGSYFTEPGTSYDSLHINVSEDKKEKNQYIVVKELPAIQSEIADQPFDEGDANKEGSRSIQFKTIVPVVDLIELGYIRKFTDKSEGSSGEDEYTPEERKVLDEMHRSGELPPDIEETSDTPAEPRRILPTSNSGVFLGERGNSAFYPNDVATQNELRSFGYESVQYTDGEPDFSPFSCHNSPWGTLDTNVEIPHMTTSRHNPALEEGFRPKGQAHNPNYDLGNYAQADNALCEKIVGGIGKDISVTPEQIEKWRISSNLIWHESRDGIHMQLVPRVIHETCRHTGGVAEMRTVMSYGAFAPRSKET